MIVVVACKASFVAHFANSSAESVDPSGAIDVPSLPKIFFPR